MIRLSALCLLLPALCVPPTIGGQSPAALVESGDREHAAADPARALAYYESALTLDTLDYDALWRAARDAVDLGELQSDATRRTTLYAKAEAYGRRAVLEMPREADGHAQLARAIGRKALTKGTSEKVKYAAEVYAQANAALAANPKHGVALHVLGVWNAEIMRLNVVSRLVAKTLLGGRVFGEASWENAQRYLEQSVAAEPDRIVHHLDLAQVYVDRGDPSHARTQYEWILAAPAREASDPQYKQTAAEAIKRLK